MHINFFLALPNSILSFKAGNLVSKKELLTGMRIGISLKIKVSKITLIRSDNLLITKKINK